MLSRRKEKFAKVSKLRQRGIVILEDIHDPHNAGAVFRSCDAFGIQNVHLIFEAGKKFNPKKVGKSSSSSANKWLDFTVWDSTAKCLKALKKKGYLIYATVLDQEAMPLNKVSFKKSKVALLFGNERNGLSKQAIALADQKLYVPMSGLVQSLNLSVTAGLCLYELNRQRQADFKKYLLPKKEQIDILKQWLKK